MLTRFAPSPTGHLHLGHLLNAIYVWRAARGVGGQVRLRIEDHDRERSRAEFETGILDDLEWLGFAPDMPPLTAFRRGACGGRQSDHPSRYEDALATLTRNGRVYGCGCSRAAIMTRTPSTKEELRYDGFCRTRGLEPGPGVGARIKLAPGVETFDDALVGAQSQEPLAQCGDLLARDRHGNWTYQFSVTVDDLVEGITDIIRGCDLLPSTGRQIQLARLLGRSSPPRFSHHPLILGPDGEKLSKSRGDTGLRELRAAGLSAADVIALAEAAAIRNEIAP